MNSPFTDYIGYKSTVQSEENESSPFYIPQPSQFSYLYDKGESAEQETDYAPTYYAEEEIDPQTHNLFESELSGTELGTAMTLNASYMLTLGWGNHLKAIDNHFIKIGLFRWTTSASRPEVLAPAIAKYQELKALKPSNKGALAIGTWSVLQKDLGLHNLTNTNKININRARKRNFSYEKTLWGKYKDIIFKNLSKAGIMLYPLPLDSIHFALAIAEFQSRKGLTIDGILGRDTHHVLISELPEEQLVARLFDGWIAYTGAYIHALSSFTDTVNNPSKEDISDLDASYEKQKLSDVGKLIFGYVQETFKAAIDEIPFASGFIKAVGIIREFKEKYDKYQHERSQMVIANKLKDFLVDERNVFADLNTFFVRNNSELKDSLSKYAKKSIRFRSVLDSAFDKIKAIDSRQEAVFQVICEKWMNVNNGFINIEFYDNWQIRRTQISGPFGSKIAERLLRNGNGKLELERFKVERKITYYPFDRSKIYPVSSYLFCSKMHDGSTKKFGDFFHWSVKQAELMKANNDFLNFVRYRTLPTVTTIISV